MAVGKGALRTPKPTTIREAWEAWHDGAKAGTIRNRSGERFKPSTIRAYEAAMRLRVLPELGGAKLADVQRPDLQRFVYKLDADGLNASTVRGTLLPLRAIYRRAVSLSEVVVNPCADLALPAVRPEHDRIASPKKPRL